MNIVEVTEDDFEEWLALALELWNDYSTEEMQSTLAEILQSPRQAGFLVRTEGGEAQRGAIAPRGLPVAIAFINLSLRSDYVPGATQSPVAFVEGIYVKPEYRGAGVGKAMIQYAEQWAREQGCIELASDALLENSASHAFHARVGFQEAERIVAFIKVIPPTE